MPTLSATKPYSDPKRPEGKRSFAVKFIDVWVFLTSCFGLFVMLGMYNDEWLIVCFGLPSLAFTLYQLQKMLLTTGSPSPKPWQR
jgi:hypothetical protein